MTTQLEPHDIASRFLKEQRNIERYVDFVEEVSTIDHNRLEDIADTLARHRVHGLRLRSEKHCEPYGDEEFQHLLDDMETLKPQIQTRIQELRDRRSQLPTPEPSELSDSHPRLFADWVDFMVSNLHEQSPVSELSVDYIFDLGLSQPFMTFRDDGELHDCDRSILKRLAFEACQASVIARIERAIHSLECILREFDQFGIMTRASSLDSEINLLRQGFILLVTAFDAAVFDLARDALKRNFYGLIAKFAKKDAKLAHAEIGKYRDHRELEADLIETTLRGYYVKDLLRIIKSANVQLVESDHEFGMLIEILDRRNVHVHNRGLVDERYLKNYTDGPALGQLAAIDGYYLERANLLCGNCIRAIAEWVALGAGFYDRDTTANQS